MDKIRLLFTHREMDSIVEALAYGLAENDSFDIFICSEKVKVPTMDKNVLLLPCPPIRGKLDFRAVNVLRSYNREYAFDLIYSVSSSGLSTAVLATLFTKAKHIAYRGTGAKIRRFDPTYYLGILNPKVNHIVCETTHVERYLREFFDQSKLSVAVKPFSLDWVRSAKEAPIEVPEFADRELRLITVANTKGRPYKGLTTLIEAVNLLLDESVSLTIVGDYEESDYQLAMTGGNKSAFYFAGQQDKAMHYMAGSDAYVLPSFRDASPRVVREAMALALPTIVSDIPGSRDLILPNETGLLFPAGNAQVLAEKIKELLHNKDKRIEMGHLGQERIKTDFSLANYIKFFVNLFQGIMK